MTRWHRHLLALAGLVAAILALFARDAIAMAGQWWNSSTYGHCLFILPLAAWLIWQRRREVVFVEPRAWPPGLAFVALAALLWLIGDAAGVALVREAALVFMIQAGVLTILGPGVLRAVLFPVFFLVFLIPFGDEFVPPMQTLTARMSMGLLGLAGVPASIDGVFITTPNGWFEVAEACAGVKFLVAMVAYGALVANVCFVSWGRRVTFMALAVVAPILANGVRAFGTIYAAHLTDVATATGFDHIVYGWFFFAFVMMIVMGVSWPFFDRKIGAPWLARTPQSVGPAGAPWPVLFAAIGVIATPLAWAATIGASGRAFLPHRVTLPVVAGWTPDAPPPAVRWAPRFDGADHRLFGRYTDGRRAVDVGIALYGWQGEGRQMVGYGQGAVDPDGKWAWASSTRPPPGGRGETMRGPNRAVREAVTFYVVDGRATGDRMTVKFRTMTDRLTGGDQSAAVIIVSAEGPDARRAIDLFLESAGPMDRIATNLLQQARS